MKRKLILITSLLTILAILFINMIVNNVSLPELTPEEQQWLSQNEGKIMLLGDPSYPPTNFVDSNGVQAGITPEIFAQMEKFLNVKFQRKNMASWDAALAEVRNNPYAILGGITKTEDRLHDLWFSQSYISIPAMIIVNTQNKSKISSMDDLVGKRVGVPKSYAIEEYLRKNYPKLILTPVINDFEGLQKVSTGELDVILTDLPTVSYLIKKYQLSNLRIAGESGYTVNLCFSNHRTEPLLNAILIKALTAVSDKEKDRIISRWITIDYNRFLFSKTFWITIMVTVTGFLMMIVGIKLWNRSLYQMVQQKTAELVHYQNHLEEMVLLKTADIQSKNEELQYALDHVQQLQGILPICASCKKIRDDNGYWNQVERYLQERSEVSFSHSVCPDCAKTLYEDFLSEEDLKTFK